jgi:hypothetical protein
MNHMLVMRQQVAEQFPCWCQLNFSNFILLWCNIFTPLLNLLPCIIDFSFVSVQTSPSMRLLIPYSYARMCSNYKALWSLSGAESSKFQQWVPRRKGKCTGLNFLTCAFSLVPTGCTYISPLIFLSVYSCNVSKGIVMPSPKFVVNFEMR